MNAVGRRNKSAPAWVYSLSVTPRTIPHHPRLLANAWIVHLPDQRVIPALRSGFLFWAEHGHRCRLTSSAGGLRLTGRLHLLRPLQTDRWPNPRCHGQ